MGSTSGSGKRNEKTKLPSPKKASGNTGGGEFGGLPDSGYKPEAKPLICLSSFETKLKQSPSLRKGLALSIKDREVTLFGAVVGKLSARQYAMVRDCEKEGVRYRGVVDERRRGRIGRYYGIFRSYRR